MPVNFARQHEPPLVRARRAATTSPAGRCADAGSTIDSSFMRRIRVDSSARTVRPREASRGQTSIGKRCPLAW